MSPLKEIGMRIGELKSTWTMDSQTCPHRGATDGCSKMNVGFGKDTFLSCQFEHCPYIEAPHAQED